MPEFRLFENALGILTGPRPISCCAAYPPITDIGSLCTFQDMTKILPIYPAASASCSAVPIDILPPILDRTAEQGFRRPKVLA